jgi:hypothetical protein
MPKANEKDLRDVPDEVKTQVAFTFVATMDEVLRIALLPAQSDGAAPEDDGRLGNGVAASADTAASFPLTSELGATINAS